MKIKIAKNGNIWKQVETKIVMNRRIILKDSNVCKKKC